MNKKLLLHFYCPLDRKSKDQDSDPTYQLPHPSRCNSLMPFLKGLRMAMWFPNNDHLAVCQAKARRDKVASLGPFSRPQDSSRELERHATATAANTALAVHLTSMVTPEGKLLPSLLCAGAVPPRGWIVACSKLT